MKSVKQYFVAIAGGLILVAVVCYLSLLILLPHVVDVNKYKGQIFALIKKDTGFEVQAEDVRLKTAFSPYLNLNAYHLKVIYPSGNTFLKITDANFKIKVIPLLFKKIEVNSASLNRPIINIILYPDCTTSLEKYIKQLSSNKVQKKENLAGFKFVPEISSIKMNRYKLRIQDVNVYSPFVFEGDKLSLSDLRFDEHLHIKTKGLLSSEGINYLNYDIDIATYLPKNSNSKFFKVSPFTNMYKYKTQGKVKAHLDITDKNEILGLVGEVDLSEFSFKIGSDILSDNNMKLAFSGQSVDVDSSIHTSASNIATILGKISYGGKPAVDLKVKALHSDLTNLHELLVATLCSLNIKNQFKDYSVTGLADLNFKIKSNFKKIESSGTSKIYNATISCKKSPLKITNINSNIDFSNDIIKINQSTALVNSTPIEVIGNINSDAVIELEIFGSKLPLSHLYKNFAMEAKYKNYIVDKGKLSFRASAFGKFNNLKVKIDSKINDIALKDIKNKAVLTAADAKFQMEADKNTFTSQISVNNASLVSESLKTKFDSKKILIDLYPKTIVIQPAVILVDGEAVFMNGKVTNYAENPTYDISFNGKLSSQALYDKLKSESNIVAIAKGKLPIVGTLKGKQNNLKLDMQITPNSSNYVSFVVIKELLNKPSLLNVSLFFDKNLINVADISLYKAGPSVKKSNSNLMGTQKIISLSGKIRNSSDIFLEDFNIKIPQSLTMSIASLVSSEVSVKSDLTVNGNFKSPKLTGDLFINKLLIPDYNLKSSDISILFKQDNINLKTSNLNINNSDFDINANILPKLGDIITVKDIKLVSSNFDLTSITNSFASLFGQELYPGVHLPLKIISGNVYISNFKVGEISAQNIASKLSLDNNLLKLSNIQGGAYNGKVWGNVDYDFLKSLSIIRLAGKNLDAPTAVYALTSINDNMRGKLDFKSNVSTSGYTRSQHIKTLKGISDIYAYNGQMGTLGKFEHYLYAQNLMSQTLMRSTVNIIAQAVAARDTGRFKYLNMHVSYSDGFANVSSLKFSGPNMSMTSTGKLNMLSGWGDFDILGRVSSEVVGVIGPFGELSLANIARKIPKLSNATLPNIFYKNYNLQVSQDVLNRIPDLTPKTDLKTKNFNVKIYGNIGSVKSVKSFRWIGLESVEQSSYATIQQSDNTTKEQKNDIPSSAKVTPVYNQPKQSTMPDFLDKLPDNFK